VPGLPLDRVSGLYGVEKDENGQAVNWFVIMTTKANQTVGRVHRKNRMAFILDELTEQLYLTEPDTEGLLGTLATPYPDEAMNALQLEKL
jgi:putative SOS response-associated peptidase YedK